VIVHDRFSTDEQRQTSLDDQIAVCRQFLDRLADLGPPRKHRHRYHGVFAPNHRLRCG
jgi:hypothetical protein